MDFDFDPISFAVGYSHGRRLASMKQAAEDYEREQTTQQAQIGDISEDMENPMEETEQGQTAPN